MIKKNTWIRNILSCVKNIASKEYQDRAWLKQEIHWPCSFGELMCKLFDDCFVEEFINEKAHEFKLTSKQKATLTVLVSALDKYGDNPEIYTHSSPPRVDEAKMFFDPEWQKIRKMAQSVLKAFGKIKYDPEDLNDWLYFILGAIVKYSDIEEQKHMWIEKSKLFFSTPWDMYDALFKHCEFDYFMDEYAIKFGLSKDQITALNRFRSQMKKTPFKTTNFEGILDNPDWQKIQVLSKETLEICNLHKK